MSSTAATTLIQKLEVLKYANPASPEGDSRNDAVDDCISVVRQHCTSPEVVDSVALNIINWKRELRLSLEEARKLGGWSDVLVDANAAIKAIVGEA